MGLCREHAHNVDTQIQNLESIENIRSALFKPPTDDAKICFGSDATVVAIGSYARHDHYTPTPLIISPSDKTEKGDQLSKWIRGTVINTWKVHEYGEKLNGEIWALASDGGSSFRQARQILCTVKKLDPLSDLGKKLSDLPGFNLYTSPEGIVGTCDPKHVFKSTSVS